MNISSGWSERVVNQAFLLSIPHPIMCQCGEACLPFYGQRNRYREVSWLNLLFSPSHLPQGKKASGSLHKELLSPQPSPALPCWAVPWAFIQCLCTTPSAGASPSPRGTALGAALLKSFEKSDMRDEKLPKPHRGLF